MVHLRCRTTTPPAPFRTSLVTPPQRIHFDLRYAGVTARCLTRDPRYVEVNLVLG